jgi:anti-anti-sigma factor
MLIKGPTNQLKRGVNENFSKKGKQNPDSAVFIFDKATGTEGVCTKWALSGPQSYTNRVREIVMLKVHAKNLGNVAVMCLQGQIVNGETEILRNAVHSLSEVSAIILDLARVTTIDAGGLGVMLELRQQAESKGIGFKLMNVSKVVSRVLEITRLDSVFEVTSGVEFFPAVSSSRRASLAALAPCA